MSFWDTKSMTIEELKSKKESAFLSNSVLKSVLNIWLKKTRHDFWLCKAEMRICAPNCINLQMSWWKHLLFSSLTLTGLLKPSVSVDLLHLSIVRTQRRQISLSVTESHTRWKACPAWRTRWMTEHNNLPHHPTCWTGTDFKHDFL